MFGPSTGARYRHPRVLEAGNLHTLRLFTEFLAPDGSDGASPSLAIRGYVVGRAKLLLSRHGEKHFIPARAGTL